jgi:hypothetical protein
VCAGLTLSAVLTLSLGGLLASSASAALEMNSFAGDMVTGAQTPTFTGTTEDTLDPITVAIFKGETATGTPVQILTTSPALSGHWSAIVVAPLEGGTYTAVAEQPELAGVGRVEVTAPYTFGVDTRPPTVTLNALPSPSNDTTPSFSGTASDTTAVSVDVYKGASAQGEPVAVVKAAVIAGNWASADVEPPLSDGTYAAQATQPSSVGNAAGVSKTVSFQVDTAPPIVTLNAPPSPSNDTTPSFSGTASEATPVTVEIFEGTRAEGNIVATVTAAGTRASWASGPVSPALPQGRHTFTALATQTSALKNPTGRSSPVTFILDTEPPAVTLAALPSPSNDTTPSFSGTASEATPVTVEIFEGTSAEGAPVATAKAKPADGARWTSASAAPALRNGTFTALATQPSGIGNAPGRSAPVTFIVDTSSPSVALNAVPSPSANRAPSFSGTASDHTPVTVDIYRGASLTGPVVATVSAEPRSGEWASGRAGPALEWGEYTAVATEPSSLGNPAGASLAMSFVVEPIAPAVATEAAATVTRTSAALYASVDPQASPVNNCYFEYGTTTAYGRTIECGFVAEISAFPLSTRAAVPVLARIFALTPATTYHFRIVAVGEGGTSAGADQAFTTLPPYAFPEEASPASGARSATRTSSTISTAKLAALVARQLVRPGRGTKIAALLRSGVFKTRFTAPEAGTVVVDWAYLPPAKAHVRTARSPLVVASGASSFHAAGTSTVSLRLTGAGKRLLSHSARVSLTATCVFTPPTPPSVRKSLTFALQR